MKYTCAKEPFLLIDKLNKDVARLKKENAELAEELAAKTDMMSLLVEENVKLKDELNKHK